MSRFQRMDQQLLDQIAALPAAKGKKQALQFAHVLADDLKELEKRHAFEVAILRKKAGLYDKLQELLARQVTSEAEYNKLEVEITKLLKGGGGKGKVNKRPPKDDDDEN